MIHIDIATYLHNLLIDEFGGSKGIRDRGSLEAALNRPFATFDGHDLYPTIVEKATAIFESIIINHPFMDGNKRTAYALLEFILRQVQVQSGLTKSKRGCHLKLKFKNDRINSSSHIRKQCHRQKQ
jgi:death-on-curing protein